MATSGSVDSNWINNFHITFEWWRISFNIASNTSLIGWQLVAHNTPGNYRTVYTRRATIDVETVLNDPNTHTTAYEGTILGSGQKTIYHNSDGSKSFYAGGGFGIGSHTENMWFENLTISLDTIPRYANFTEHYLNGTTMTSQTIKWTADAGCDAVQYRLNGGSWVATSGVNYTVSGLTANTYYTIQTRIKRTDSQLWTESSVLGFTTLNYARAISANNFNSDASPYMTFSNPAGATIDVYLEFGETNIMRTNIPNTGSYTFTLTSEERNLLYSKCPNAKTLAVRYVIATKVGGVQTYWSWLDRTMTVVGSNPTFSDFTYEDTNATTLALTGDDQKIIKKYSNLKTTISSANKMVAKNYATAVRYDIITNTTTSVAYSTSNVDSTHNAVNSNTIKVSAVDSRWNITQVVKSLDIIAYSEPIISNMNFQRKDGIGTTVLVIGNGTYTDVDFGEVNNIIDSIEWRIREVGEEFGEWESIKGYFNIATGEFENKTSNEIIGTTFTLGTEYEIEVRIIDKLATTTSLIISLNSGKVLMDCVKGKGVAFGGLYDEDIGGSIQLKEQNIFELINGWINPNETWTYASSTTITVPSGAVSKYAKGDKIRFKQGADYKYFYIIGIADTVLTVTGGSDYKVENSAITDIYYSHATSPVGFPQWFNYLPSFINIAVGNATGIFKFSITGKTVNVETYFVLGSTSAINNTINIRLPTYAGTPPGTPLGLCYVEDAGVWGGVCIWQLSNATTVNLVAQKVDGTYSQNWNTQSSVPFLWGNTDFFMGTITYQMA